MGKVNIAQIKENVSVWTKDHKGLIVHVAVVGANCFVWYTVGKMVQNKRDNTFNGPLASMVMACCEAIPEGSRFKVHPFRNENIGKFNQMNRVIEILDDPEAREEVLGAVLFTKADD